MYHFSGFEQAATVSQFLRKTFVNKSLAQLLVHLLFKALSKLTVKNHGMWLAVWFSCLPCHKWCNIIIMALVRSHCGNDAPKQLEQLLAC
jgi:hypothetical protein